jgi:heterodisulfide reductase subunit C
MKIEISSEKLHSDFVNKVIEISGENLPLCYQCGMCSAGCPMAFAMDLLPNQIIRLAQLGFEEDIAKSKTIWICASCMTCTVRCPRGINVGKVMETLRLITLRKNIKNVDYIKPNTIPAEALAEYPPIAMVGAFRKLTG